MWIAAWPFFFLVVAPVLLTGCMGGEPICVPNLSEDADGGSAVLCK
jgi:hypothetical protein